MRVKQAYILNMDKHMTEPKQTILKVIDPMSYFQALSISGKNLMASEQMRQKHSSTDDMKEAMAQGQALKEQSAEQVKRIKEIAALQKQQAAAAKEEERPEGGDFDKDFHKKFLENPD
mmetsp:Transcript_4934/g.7394  ORF Transcript_4934/g.7394 Transcript_4934/m.7394 type:complete len:118 (+) Transcript_4934:158-511(+)|eukprot:CAMPEP_0170491880 /NCGR_PEP_ID=MMETSP0208-20121228/11308_1 /TAXON_ID=197538 /ORGANISM="Strombidium inclinatum, Strain S3" /LENGTH=117 /DNA_ID=CAMNT_0010767525 /DNA_START=158 /DNA_END=511 /DNA_ORIENTATION=+